MFLKIYTFYYTYLPRVSVMCFAETKLVIFLE